MSKCRTQEYLVLWKLSDLKTELPGVRAMGDPGGVEYESAGQVALSDF